MENKYHLTLEQNILKIKWKLVDKQNKNEYNLIVHNFM